MNYTHIAGHLGSDPETRFTSGGKKVTTLRVGCKARKGETIWWKVTIWGEAFDKMLTYFKKGSSIVVIGEMSKPEIYTDREGNPQVSMQLTAHHVSFSPFGKSKEQEGNNYSGSGNSYQANEPVTASVNHSFSDTIGSGGGSSEEPDFSDDEIPF